MSILIYGMEFPKHAAFNGKNNTIYRAAVVVHADGTAKLVFDLEASFIAQDRHNITKYPLIEIPTLDNLIDRRELLKKAYSIMHDEEPAEVVHVADIIYAPPALLPEDDL